MKALNPITPADASAGKCERLSVIKPPQSAKSTIDDACAAVTFAWNAAAVVVGGRAFGGISPTVVTPPAPAARAPGPHPVPWVRPGSLQGTWGSPWLGRARPA